MEALNELVDEIEAEQERGMVPAFKVFRSILNQPSLLTISSANAVNLSQTTNGFTTFQVNLPRPIFEVESIQLVNANIPQCSPNVPDTACVFWYYRTSQYSGVVPNTNNLYYVRLLPSYYKPESILNSSNYGFNRTFVSYPDLATELALACSNDLAYYNYSQNISNFTWTANQYQINFIPGDISITYNSRFNRFQMTGSNAFTPFATKGWASSNTYASNDIVYYTVPDDSTTQPTPYTATYQSLVNANSNQNPFTATAYWKQIDTDIVQPFDSNTPYRKGALVRNSTGTIIYKALYQSHLFDPRSANPVYSYNSNYNYGFGDLAIYGSGSPSNVYTNIYPSSNISPSDSNYWLRTYWSNTTTYPQGFITYYATDSNYYVSLIPNNVGAIPPNIPTAWSNIGTSLWTTYTTSPSNPNYRYLSAGFNDPNVSSNQGPTGIPNTTSFTSSEELNWSPYALYETGALVRYSNSTYLAQIQNLGYVPFDISASLPAWSSTTRYSPGYVVTFNNLNFISTQNSLNQPPSLFSTYWTQQQWTNLVSLSNYTGAWNSNTSYVSNDLVSYSDPQTQMSVIYKCNYSNTGRNPSAFTSKYPTQYWYYYDSPTLSLAPISAQFDLQEIFVGNSGSNSYLGPFPSSIAGQPFANPVRRTLNSLTGFTWNGVMNPASINSATTPTLVGTSFAIQSQNVDLFNRLRPIPDYVIVNSNSYSNALLGANGRTSTTTQTYTADGYANLNFSSIISLYTTIASASTMDTDRNTNLLATCPMNCVNLGVSFFEPKIANEILIRGVQLDTISISMFDEFGNAYVVTNNGVVTITLRLTYKDRLHIK